MDAAAPHTHSAIAAIPEEEARKICAGEVIERPLNVVKELIENSLDAGAQSISIELEDGGKRLIRVTDDGRGIPAAELSLALRPHHTSKLRSLDDLYNLSTLGFRGEGLNSISVVSRLTLTSRAASDELGARIESVEDGEELSHVNMALGTEVEVRELFYNVPVRQKFLRSSQSETSQVSAMLIAYALAYPEVKWSLKSGGRSLLSTDGDGGVMGVMEDLLGEEFRGRLIPLDFEFPPSALGGVISDPVLHRTNRSRQWFFVNRRPVVNKVLYRAVDDAVREFMSQGKFPAGAFMLELPPEEIDVNVHPMKSEVSFAQPQGVYSLLITGVKRALGEAAKKRQRSLSQGLASAVQPVQPQHRPRHERDADAGDASRQQDIPLSPAETTSTRSVPVYDMNQRIAVPKSESSEARELRRIEMPRRDPSPQLMEPVPEDAKGEALPDIDPASIYQIAGAYLAVPTGDALYLVDQHAAHERIIFEKLWANFSMGLNEKALRQELVFPLELSLTPGEREIADTYLEAAQAVGFDAALSETGLAVSAVPLVLRGLVTDSLMHTVLTELAELSASGSLENTVKELSASLACRAAIKANDKLSGAERHHLLGLLLSNWSTLSCPHGRPTIVRLDSRDFERIFLRDRG